MGGRRRRRGCRGQSRLLALSLSLQLLLGLELRFANSFVALFLLSRLFRGGGASGGLGGLPRFVFRLLFDHPLLDFLFLLQRLDEGRFQAVRVFGLERLFRVGGDARLANDVLAAGLFSLPHGRVIGAALNADERREDVFDIGRWMTFLRRVVVFDVFDDFLEPDEKNEFGSVGVGDEIELRRGRFRGRNLKKSFFQLFP